MIGIDVGSAAGDRTFYVTIDGRGRVVASGRHIDLDPADCRQVDL